MVTVYCSPPMLSPLWIFYNILSISRLKNETQKQDALVAACLFCRYVTQLRLHQRRSSAAVNIRGVANA